MNKIPKTLNDELNEDPFYRRCCLSFLGGCGGKNIYGRTIERHHALIFAGKQVQAKYCILPACPNHHALANRKDIKERFDWVWLNRATDVELSQISKLINYVAMRDRLNLKYKNEHITFNRA